MSLKKARTSKSHPLQIASIKAPGGTGMIGITLCPGKQDPGALTGAWERDLDLDVAAIRAWKAEAVVCLMEQFELKLLGVEALPATVEEAGIRWFHLPIKDVSVPTAAFEKKWETKGAELREILGKGGHVLVHCRGGLGRSGTIAARLLVELGLAPGKAIASVREQRQGAIETSAQEAYVLKQQPPASKPVPKGGASDREDRAVGCLLGLAIGDALGTTLEFSSRDSLPPVTGLVGGGPFKLKAGQWTDDTSMALCLAHSLLERGDLDPLDLMTRFRKWRDLGHNSVTGHCFDIGITTSQAISRFGVDKQPLAGSGAPEAAGNGSIMRLAPIPIFFGRDPEKAEAAAVLQSQTTHGAQECLDACRLMTRILVRLIDGQSWDDALAGSGRGLKTPKVKRLALGTWRGRERHQIKSTGYVIDTLEAALWAVNSTVTFADAVLLAVNLGGDADTVGAVAGQLAGARYGYKATPVKWASEVAWEDRIRSLALALCAP